MTLAKIQALICFIGLILSLIFNFGEVFSCMWFGFLHLWLMVDYLKQK